MTVQNFDPNKTITITPAAAAHFREQLQHKGAAGVRIGLKKSGCTGFKYVIEESAAPHANDLVLTLANGVAVYFSPADAASLRGMEIDYTQQGLNRTLKIENPNVTSQCGCGESFDVKPRE
ncbi:MAG: iron-sulfur cluster assembly accessory protein [Pseudomonadales bacterium]|nr:iron-sulfur cluster assembly accessory protein [Pseudomonadales bacterium]